MNGKLFVLVPVTETSAVLFCTVPGKVKKVR